MKPVRICFVCLGNICRSPTSEGVMAHLLEQQGLADQVELDSAGTGGWHIGDPPDRRSAATARQRGMDLFGHSRQFKEIDFDRFDFIVAMDRSNLRALRNMAANETDIAKLSLLRSFDPTAPPMAEVPDPYYGGPNGFDEVLDICIRGCEGMIRHLQERDLLQKS